jgi:2-polyprenyl-3-methyl-5-hydroxy-6-metoxy-1,4-benzoquinol methylase
MARQIDRTAVKSNLPCWCGSDEWQICFRTPRFGLVRCADCECYRIDPPPILKDSDSPTFYTDYYSQHSGKGCSEVAASSCRTSRFWQVVEQVPELSRIRQTVADIGCGEGHLCAELKAAGWPSIIGLDVSRARVARARQLYPQLDFYERSLDETDLAAGSLDLAVMDNVIEHLPEPVVMLQRLRRHLSAEGKLVVITPNMNSGHFRLLGRRWTPELAPHAHIYLFTPASIRRLLLMTGFNIEALGSFHSPLYSWRGWLRRLKSGDVKGALWRAGQETGGLYGRLLGAGEMLYAVGRMASPDRGRS